MTDLWPAIDYDATASTAEYVHRLSQIGGKYALFAPYSTGFGCVALRITARGFATSTIWANDTTFEIHYEILDDRVTVTSDLGSESLPLASGSVSDFYARFRVVAQTLGLPKLPTTLESEIAGSPHLDTDAEHRFYDPRAARTLWRAFASASRALTRWQASFRGHAAPVGIMFGGFDLFAPRFASAWTTPPTDKPMFMQNSENAADVVVGFALGTEQSKTASFFAYATPPSAQFSTADFGVPGAVFNEKAGLASLPWDVVRATSDPEETVLTFADAVYAAARRTSDAWPADLERRDGWYASKHLVKST